MTYRKPANSLPDLVSDGRPFQFLELAYRPLYKRPGSEFPYEHVVVKVSLPGETREQATKWSVVSELAYGDNPCVQVDPVAGTLEFGDGIRGKIPPSGGQIWVESYRYVAGGSVGNVGSGSVRLLQRPIDGINAVTNPGPGRSGVDEEEIEQTKVRAPQALKNRDRAVTTADFEYLAREASNRVQKVRCLPPASTGSSNPQVPITSGRLNRSEGHLNVLIVSNSPGAIPPLEWDLIREVQDHLDARRMITTRLHVASPRFVPIRVDVRYRLFPPPPGGVVRTATFAGNLENALREAMNAYLHPLTGRPSQVGSNDGQGWEIGQSLFAFELFDHLKSVLGRDGYLTQMKLFRVFPGEVDETLFGQFKLTPDDGVSLADFEMICAADPSLHVIQPGDSL